MTGVLDFPLQPEEHIRTTYLAEIIVQRPMPRKCILRMEPSDIGAGGSWTWNGHRGICISIPGIFVLLVMAVRDWHKGGDSVSGVLNVPPAVGIRGTTSKY